MNELNKGVLSEKTLLKKLKNVIKVSKPHQREHEITKSNSLLRKGMSPIKEKRLKSRLKHKAGRFENVISDKVKKNKSLSGKVKRKEPGYKVREPKVNTVDRDALKERSMLRILRTFARYSYNNYWNEKL